MKIDSLSAPVLITWQLTRDCDLACLHCCTDSAPGKSLPNELTREESLGLAQDIARAGVPYVMLAGGEPTLVPHFLEVAEALGQGGVFLKIETNGQTLTEAAVTRLAKLPIRSIQISMDGASPETYAKMRPNGELKAVLAACRLVRRANLPLEITFAPTKLNIHEAEGVIALALDLGAFRFNTGQLMRVGRAGKLWSRLEPSSRDYEEFLRLLELKETELADKMDLQFRPFSMAEDLSAQASEPPGTMLVLPDGKVKVSAALPYLCADLRRSSLSQAWGEYRKAWENPRILQALKRAGSNGAQLAKANEWAELENDLPASLVGPA